MDEKPKSIWRRPWQGYYRWFGAWLMVVVATFFAVLIITQFLPGGPRSLSDWLGALTLMLVASFVIAAGLVGLWIFIRRLCCRRNLKRFLFGLACFATLIALFYAEENWRGKHDWEKFKREWEAKGERFDWQSIVPLTVPEDQNFAFSPVWIAEEKFIFQNRLERARAWYGDRINNEDVSKIVSQLPVSTAGLVGTNSEWRRGLPNVPETLGSWAAARVTDLKPWQSYYRNLETTNPAAGIPTAPQPQTPAQDVLLALSKFDPVIEQLRTDSARSDSRFPLGYDDEDKAAILLPHLAALKRYAQVLQLRAIAELKSGQTKKALDDVKLMMRLTAAIRTEPFLISHLVRIALLQIALQPIYEGLAEHKWSDAQLVQLESELAGLDFVADYNLSMHGEMGFQDGIIRYLRNHPELYRNLMAIGNDTGHNRSAAEFLVAAAMNFHLVPSGWFYQNQLGCAQAMEEFYLSAVDVHQQIFRPAWIRQAEGAIEKQRKNLTPFDILANIMLPDLGGAAKKFASAQASVDLARAAIALERHRLARGEFPESLEALVPQFVAQVPHDVIGGQPLKYRREANGQFILYSVGWNETDDGGVIGYRKGSTVPDFESGDWVWRYLKKE